MQDNPKSNELVNTIRQIMLKRKQNEIVSGEEVDFLLGFVNHLVPEETQDSESKEIENNSESESNNSEELDIVDIPIEYDKKEDWGNLIEHDNGVEQKDSEGGEDTDTSPATDELAQELENLDELQVGEEIDLSIESKENDKAPLLANVDTSKEKQEVEMIEKKTYSLKNPMIGRYYSADLKEAGIDTSAILSIQGLEEKGLEYDAESHVISGTPSEVGDVELMINMEDSATTEHYLRFFVNPDPKSLWKNLPTPADAPYHTPDNTSQVLDTVQSRLVAASQRGRSHAHEGKFRDDAYSIFHSDSGWAILAVSDGAGSAKYSRKGSEIACHIAQQEMNKMLQQYGAQLEQNISQPRKDTEHDEIMSIVYKMTSKVINAVSEALKKEAVDMQAETKDYNATLLFTIHKRIGAKHFIASYGIGDGAAVVRLSEDKILPLMDPDGGEFAGQTRFITMSEAVDPTDIASRIRIENIDTFESIILMTDGVSDPKFGTDANLLNPSLWNDFYKELTAEVNLLGENAGSTLEEYLDFWSRGNHDDRTLAMLINK